MFGKRIGAAVAAIGVATLFGAGVSTAGADEPKSPKPQSKQPAPVPQIGEFGKAQEKLMRAMELLARNPSDPAARKMMDEAFDEMMKGMSGGLPEVTFPALAHERPRLGVRLAPLAESAADQLSLKNGVVIAGVLDGTPAAKAGFKKDDILVEFAGKAVGRVFLDPRQRFESHARGGRLL